ncbi:MAG: amidohydrolase family protein [Deltaproteobacteria bacterium]|nr:amidohydrolase family protein [Deltaproteobacteria bacterium]
MLITRADIGAKELCDLRLAEGRVYEMGCDLDPEPGEWEIDAEGATVIPGLHDHHIHLMALAAASDSVHCGPPEVNSPEELSQALALWEGAGAWIRGVGYHDSVAGELDRHRLDELYNRRPVRIQHRSGAMWIVNSLGAQALGLDGDDPPPDIERDESGQATGQLFRMDHWLRDRWEKEQSVPNLKKLSLRLASYGVTGLTDATPTNGQAELSIFEDALAKGELLQHLMVMGSGQLPLPNHPLALRGAFKIMLDDVSLPAFESLHWQIERAHMAERPVAIHCVTRASLLLALGVFMEAHTIPGDRIEHSGVTPPEALDIIQKLPITVVTQPNFIHERGDAYLTDVDPKDQPWLYRCRAFLDAEVPLGGGTDAPFGHPDPWRAMRAAVERTTTAGQVMGPDERLTPEQALGLFTSSPETPGIPAPAIRLGMRADLCLLDRPWSEARENLSSDCLRATIRAGEVIWAKSAL